MPNELIEAIEAKALAAIAAEEAGDLTRAIQLLNQLQIAMAAIPDGAREEESFTFDRESVAAAISNLRRKQAAAAGVQHQRVRIERG